VLSRTLIFSFIAVFVLSSLSFVVSVEADSSMWSQTYGGTGFEEAYALVEISDGGYAIAGYSGVNNCDFWLFKTDEFGYMEWNKTYGGTLWDYAESLISTSDGGYAIVGSTHSVSQSICDDVWLVKTDEFGNEEWNRTYGGPYWDGAYSIIATSDGGYALAGYTGFSGRGNVDWWLVKIDEIGNMEWNTTWAGDTDHDRARALIETSDGGYAITGSIGPFAHNRFDLWLVKTDAYGKMEWNKTCEDALGNSLVATSDGGYVIAGEKGGDFWLIKTDELGNEEWNRTYGGTGYDEAHSLVKTSDGGYAIAGTWDYEQWQDLVTGEEVARGRFWLVKTDEFGNMEWNQTYGESDFNVAHSLVATSDGGFAIAGYTKIGAEDYDVWLVKTDESGVVPEYFSCLLLSLLLTATLVIVIYKKKFFDDQP
jgi:hypothetical protein